MHQADKFETDLRIFLVLSIQRMGQKKIANHWLIRTQTKVTLIVRKMSRLKDLGMGMQMQFYTREPVRTKSREILPSLTVVGQVFHVLLVFFHSLSSGLGLFKHERHVELPRCHIIGTRLDTYPNHPGHRASPPRLLMWNVCQVFILRRRLQCLAHNVCSVNISLYKLLLELAVFLYPMMCFETCLRIFYKTLR